MGYVILFAIVFIIVVSIVVRRNKQNELKESASRGDPKAQFDLGVSYLHRDKIPEAKEWLEKALEKGYSEAKSKLRVCALIDAIKKPGFNVRCGGEDELKYYEEWAERGKAIYQWLLGSVYKDGFLVDGETGIHYVLENLWTLPH